MQPKSSFVAKASLTLSLALACALVGAAGYYYGFQDGRLYQFDIDRAQVERFFRGQ